MKRRKREAEIIKNGREKVSDLTWEQRASLWCQRRMLALAKTRSCVGGVRCGERIKSKNVGRCQENKIKHDRPWIEENSRI
ncbi:hypothetical protein VIGAN_04016300 [Vigna angularis var. angularis]|uniref:Uncharacterized protein n=1 Tax=Vigna angularis var. angularis TaxID=157739 RepID=A0A0S3RR25_PHAAN|nr:hypothetical protein VIGAN_04016300 [Vigna angularis var. angularis]